MSIPVRAVPFQKFRVDIGIVATVIIKWSTRFSYFTVDIYDGEEPITLGRGLHPDIDLLDGLNLGFGKLVLLGKAPTVKNLGIENELVHEVL